MLVIVLVAVLVLVLAGVGAFIYISKQRAAAALDDQEQPADAQQAEPSGPPVYLPLDNMVVNLADPGGDRVAQVGITFELRDAEAGETVKQYLPTIRSGVLLLVSQMTSEELLQARRQGKAGHWTFCVRRHARLAAWVTKEAEPPKSGTDQPGKASERVRPGDLPVQRVHFSSFIVQ